MSQLRKGDVQRWSHHRFVYAKEVQLDLQDMVVVERYLLQLHLNPGWVLGWELHSKM